MSKEESIPMGAGVLESGELADMSEEENTRVITDMIDFYHTARASNMTSLCPEIENFTRAFEGINKGCGCSRKNRVKNTENLYVALSNLEDEKKQLIKDSLSVEKVQLFHEGSLFSEF